MKKVFNPIIILLFLFIPSIAKGFTYKTQYSTLNAPTSLTIDSKGNIYVADSGNNKIVKLSSDLTSNTEITFPITPLVIGDYIKFDPSDYFYMITTNGAEDDNGDIMNSVIQIDTDSNWNPVREKYGKAGTGDYNFELDSISGIFVTGNDLYIADTGSQRIVKFNFVSKDTSVSGNLNLNSPFAVAVDSNENNIYIADTGNHRIVKLNSSFEYVSQFGVTGEAGDDDSHLDSPAGVYVDNLGSIYIADTGNSRIIKLDYKFKYVTEFDATRALEDSSSHLSSPVDIAVDGNYGVYVIDIDNNILVKMSQIVLTTASLSDAEKGKEYTQTLTVSAPSESEGALTWSVESGNLPEGITLEDDLLSGASAAEGVYEFTIKVTGDNDFDKRPYSLEVKASGGGGQPFSPGGASPAGSSDSGSNTDCFISSIFEF